MVRRSDPDRVVVIEQHLARHVGQKIFRSFVDSVLGELVLLVGVFFHEKEGSGLLIEEGGVRLVDVGGF